MEFTEEQLKEMMDLVRARRGERTGPMVLEEKSAKRRSGLSESAIQRRCVAWFRGRHPGMILFAIPNGGGRTKTQGAILKAEGVLAGVPDLLLAYPSGIRSGLFIEMKNDSGRVRPEQKAMMKELSSLGYECVICRSEDDFKDAVSEYLDGRSVTVGKR